MKFVFRTSGGSIKFCGLVEDSDIGCLSSITVRMGYLFAFQFWYFELCVENWWRGGRKHCFANFVVEGCWGGAKSLISGRLLRPVEMVSFSSRDFCQSITHSDMLYRTDISTFYFYEPLFQIFVPFTVKSHTDNHFYKYICFKYYTVWKKYSTKKINKN